MSSKPGEKAVRGSASGAGWLRVMFKSTVVKFSPGNAFRRAMSSYTMAAAANTSARASARRPSTCSGAR